MPKCALPAPPNFVAFGKVAAADRRRYAASAVARRALLAAAAAGDCRSRLGG
jgi:hypothetical protein